MSRESFDLELGRLAVLPGMPGESDAYWETLKDIPEDVFTSAVGHALKTRKWFPVPVELRQDADIVKPRATFRAPSKPHGRTRVETIANPYGKDIHLTVYESDGYHCLACCDIGIESVWCGEPRPTMKPWHERVRCGSGDEHLPHEWARKCACDSTNPVLARKREAQGLYAAQREEKR